MPISYASIYVSQEVHGRLKFVAQSLGLNLRALVETYLNQALSEGEPIAIEAMNERQRKTMEAFKEKEEKRVRLEEEEARQKAEWTARNKEMYAGLDMVNKPWVKRVEG